MNSSTRAIRSRGAVEASKGFCGAQLLKEEPQISTFYIDRRDLISRAQMTREVVNVYSLLLTIYSPKACVNMEQ